jgi:hypothetical protein
MGSPMGLERRQSSSSRERERDAGQAATGVLSGGGEQHQGRRNPATRRRRMRRWRSRCATGAGGRAGEGKTEAARGENARGSERDPRQLASQRQRAARRSIAVRSDRTSTRAAGLDPLAASPAPAQKGAHGPIRRSDPAGRLSVPSTQSAVVRLPPPAARQISVRCHRLLAESGRWSTSSLHRSKRAEWFELYANPMALSRQE